jgi:hypothetical protein
MPDLPQHSPKKLRSPSFPALGLSEAVSKAKVIWEKETRHAVPADVAVTHWGYSPKSSGGKQAVAALLKYGLFEESGSNQSRTVKLTDRALRILLGRGDESKNALRDAALEPDLHRLLWDSYRGTLPSDETLKRNLILDHKFNPSSVQDAIASYKDSLDFSGLSGEIHPHEGQFEQPTIQATEPVAQGPLSFFERAFNAPSKPGPAVPQQSSLPVQPPMISAPPSPDSFLPIPLDCGMNALIPRGMSEDDFSILLDTLKLWKRKIVRSEWPKDAIWHNADHDQPVVVIGPMGEKDGVKYYRTSTGTGIPESELEFK